MNDLSKLVKPLVWTDFDGMGAKAEILGLPISYLIARWGDGRFEITVSAPGYSAGFDGDRFRDTLEAAKVACQTDYEARILAALDTDAIERLTAENARMRDVLQQIAAPCHVSATANWRVVYEEWRALCVERVNMARAASEADDAT